MLCFKTKHVTHVYYIVSWVSVLLGANIRLKNRHLERVSIVCRVTNVCKKVLVALCIYKCIQPINTRLVAALSAELLRSYEYEVRNIYAVQKHVILPKVRKYEYF
jgi:hypothetical protein